MEENAKQLESSIDKNFDEFKKVFNDNLHELKGSDRTYAMVSQSITLL